MSWFDGIGKGLYEIEGGLVVVVILVVEWKELLIGYDLSLCVMWVRFGSRWEESVEFLFNEERLLNMHTIYWIVMNLL